MGTVFKKVFTKPLPANAEVVVRQGKRIAKWKANGKSRSATVTTGKDGTERILIEAGTYTAKYRDGSGVVREVATGCRDETAARRFLGDLERRAELFKARVISAAAYGEHLRAGDVTEGHRKSALSYLRRLAKDTGFARLMDLDRTAVETWLAKEARNGRSARSRNAFRNTAVAFGNWCVQNRRLQSNPFLHLPKVNESADPRRKRRALTEAELVRLLDATRKRPLHDAMTIRRGAKAGQRSAQLSDETRERLEWIGRERALILKTYLLTGMRKGELASLTIANLDLDAETPHAILDAANEKNRKGSEILFRDDLAEELRSWLAAKLRRLQLECRNSGEPIPARLPADTLLFDVPAGLLRILNRDLEHAGIPKRDERGRTIDVHGLRTTFGTLLSKGGVSLRTAQAAMRHSDPRLTANVYTDPKLLDIRGALDALPALSLTDEHASAGAAAKATGTDDIRAGAVAPTVAPTLAQTGLKLSFPGKVADGEGEAGCEREGNVTSMPVNENGRLSTRDNRPDNRGDRIRTCDLLHPIQPGNPWKNRVKPVFPHILVFKVPFASCCKLMREFPRFCGNRLVDPVVAGSRCD
jgi:integrase